jgi:hypothetical protein
LLEKTAVSNTVIIKIITPKSRQFFYIALPILIGLTTLGIYFWQIKKYKKKRTAYERSEMHIFELSSRESILKIDHTLRERLNIIVKTSKEQFHTSEKNEDVKKLKDINKRRDI